MILPPIFPAGGHPGDVHQEGLREALWQFFPADSCFFKGALEKTLFDFRLADEFYVHLKGG
jgi:hypothetical protein